MVIEREKAVCFTGHRVIRGDRKALYEQVERQVKDLIAAGAVSFLTGGARGFDALAAEVVLAAKETAPWVQLWVVLPFDRPYEVEGDWTEEEIALHQKQNQQADHVCLLKESYGRGSYHKRNRYLVDHAAWCVYYQWKKTGGTAYTVSYAQQEGLCLLAVGTETKKRKRQKAVSQ